MRNNRPPMILAQPHVSEEPIEPTATAAPAEPVIQRQHDLSAEMADTDSPSVDVFRVAERVYQLMREDLSIERTRRGLKSG